MSWEMSTTTPWGLAFFRTNLTLRKARPWCASCVVGAVKLHAYGETEPVALSRLLSHLRNRRDYFTRAEAALSAAVAGLEGAANPSVSVDGEVVR